MNEQPLGMYKRLFLYINYILYLKLFGIKEKHHRIGHSRIEQTNLKIKYSSV